MSYNLKQLAHSDLELSRWLERAEAHSNAKFAEARAVEVAQRAGLPIDRVYQFNVSPDWIGYLVEI